MESPAAISAWLRRGHAILEGETPLEWAQPWYGAQRVKELLVALKHGGVV
ncbi:antitoxin Xre/MbcA/ParS toxin-binding domain-containing protein [Acidovorax delafieldii]